MKIQEVPNYDNEFEVLFDVKRDKNFGMVKINCEKYNLKKMLRLYSSIRVFSN